MLDKPTISLTLAVALMVMLPVQQAASATLTNPGGPAPEAPDQTLGTALMGAVLNAGTLNTGFSNGAVSSSRTSAGVYSVKFGRSLSSCTPMVTAFTANRTASLSGPSPSDTWNIQTRDLAGALADSDVLVLTLCTR